MCCGRNRQVAPGGPAPLRAAAPAGAAFEYVGNTALTVVSPLTGRQYRFAKPGARVEVDARDRSWVSFVPHLRRAD
jgi:hypothetical protein